MASKSDLPKYTVSYGRIEEEHLNGLYELFIAGNNFKVSFITCHDRMNSMINNKTCQIETPSYRHTRIEFNHDMLQIICSGICIDIPVDEIMHLIKYAVENVSKENN